MNFDFSKQRSRKLAIIDKTKTRLIDIESIIYLKCDGYVTTIHLIAEEIICVSKLLKLFEFELSEFGFLRVNHNTIVNPLHIQEISSDLKEKIKVIHINNSEVKVSRRKAYLFKNLTKNDN